MKSFMQKPTKAFLAASWTVLFVGAGAYLLGLWYSTMTLNEKGFYFTVLMYGLFAAVSLQKSVRDRLEGIFVTDTYFNLCSFSLALSVFLEAIGLWNAMLTISAKGFYAVSFVLALFAAITIQKNIRDIELIDHESQATEFDDDKEQLLKK
jgi:uncharacterized membrane protein YiaA